MQHTLRSVARFSGIGLHTGRQVRMVIHPAAADSGIWFRRTDVSTASGVSTDIAAQWHMIAPSDLCTRIANSDGVSVSTIEHVMAALAGCGIHNARIDVDGPEVPVLDGSAAPIVDALLAAGTRRLAAPLQVLRVLRPVEVRAGAAIARLEPASSLQMAFEIDFDAGAIGHQALEMDLGGTAFIRTLSDSRTFCLQSDVDSMRASGLARGGSYHNAVVFDGDRVLSPGGLRHADEPVRHKMLDAIGDLALAGAPLLARYVGHRAGHALTGQLLAKLFSTPGAVESVYCDEPCARGLPGMAAQSEGLQLSA